MVREGATHSCPLLKETTEACYQITEVGCQSFYTECKERNTGCRHFISSQVLEHKVGQIVQLFNSFYFIKCYATLIAKVLEQMVGMVV